MPEIEISETQRRYLDELRTRIAEEHVGPYGHVRMREVVQFLIDRHEARGGTEREAVREAVRDLLGEKSYQELQSLAADTEGVEPGGKAPDLRERLVEARVHELLGRLDWSAGSMANRGADAIEGSDTSGAADVEETPDADRTAKGNDLGDSAGSDEEEPQSAESGQDGGARLQRMMELLDSHADKWEENESDQGKYAVTLPDGSVQNVRTKDDVRGLLFKHYV